MRPKQSLKSLLRTPFKTILTFLLIAAASFALFSRVTDYAVTSREMNRALDYYNGVAALNTGTPYTATQYKMNHILFYEHFEWLYGIKPPPALNQNLIDTFSALPGVTSTDTRYMTGGVIEGYRRFYNASDFDYNYEAPFLNKLEDFWNQRVIYGYDYTGRYIMEGTFTGYEVRNAHNAPNMHYMVIEDCVLIAGDYPISSDGSIELFDFALGRGGLPLTLQTQRTSWKFCTDLHMTRGIV
ncbi:MAG: hypothetical protein LBC86_04465 [Oscillospiraceae bacterium]|jgi:hypothetical protein|nr:hypothetical protein [Oscillospiraceae bacterium]